MNWFRKATIMNPLEINWDEISLELEEEFGRKPLPGEVQKRLMQKYWEMVDIIEDKRRRGSISDIC